MRFTFKGKEYLATGKNVETYYGPELAVEIVEVATGNVVGHSQECASVAMQVEWWKEFESEDYGEPGAPGILDTGEDIQF